MGAVGLLLGEVGRSTLSQRSCCIPLRFGGYSLDSRLGKARQDSSYVFGGSRTGRLPVSLRVVLPASTRPASVADPAYTDAPTEF